MCTIIRLDEQPVRDIILHTRKRTEIPNGSASEVTEWGDVRRQLAELRRRFPEGPGTTFRTELSPFYNCHGMTFASRRTCVEPDWIRKIIADDAYEPVKPQDVQPGDVIVYVANNGDLEHSGVVVGRPEQLGGLPIPLVCSKWGQGPEVVHWANRCPYAEGFANVEYWRVRV